MLRDLCLQGRIFLDIGGNYGYFTCRWAGAEPANRVLAIEPDPRNFQFLKFLKTIEKNFLAGQVELTGNAVSRAYGTMPFFDGSDERTGLGRLMLKKNDRTISADEVALDE